MSSLRILIVGCGIQGNKRRGFLGNDFSGSVDPVAAGAQYKSLSDVPLSSFDAALVCMPYQGKYETIHYLLSNKKHVLAEKPLLLQDEQFAALEDLSLQHNLVSYTAYNHRFEQHFINMKRVLDSGVLGKIYSCRMFYGNGTALDVKNSDWKDQGYGVVYDIGSHLLDTALFWFGHEVATFGLECCHKFENNAPDHAIMVSRGTPFIELEMTLLSWRNSFCCTILAENGSAHIDSLCKWGPSTLTVRNRIRPSGRPTEESKVLIQSDQTWQAEYDFFKNLC
ncbi:MAG: Gfo/Idh/MocA family oxidoreductase, partial [Holosporales bacterium]|nr:Gfo/Idh/MocA family oxidoreductase [Holosporales bacterium]